MPHAATKRYLALNSLAAKRKKNVISYIIFAIYKGTKNNSLGRRKRFPTLHLCCVAERDSRSLKAVAAPCFCDIPSKIK